MKGVAILVFCAALTAAERFPSIADIVCAHEGSDGTLVPHEYCNRFYNCHAGRPVAFDCPAGLVYNIREEYCDWPSNVFCGLRPIPKNEKEHDKNDSTWVPEHGHNHPSLVHEICAAKKSENVLLAAENCSQYYQCVWGVPFVRDCPKGLFFNPARKACDWPRNVDCGHHGDRNIAVNTQI